MPPTKTAEPLYYLRLNIEAGVRGRYTLNSVPGKGDIVLTEESHVCSVGLPESYVRRAQLHKETYHHAAQRNRPGRDVPRFKFARMPWPAPAEKPADRDIIPVEGDIPVDDVAAEDNVIAGGDPHAAPPDADAPPPASPKGSARGRNAGASAAT